MRRSSLLSILFLGLSASAFADTVTTFDLVNNTFVSGAAASGTVSIDTSDGTFQSIDVTVVESSGTYTFLGAPAMQGSFNNDTQYFEYSWDAGKDLLTIDVPGANLVGYTGSDLCTFDNLCGDGYLGYFAFSDGTVDAAVSGSLAATPEPSSIILLGTGVLGLFGAARRRLTRLNGMNAL